MADNDKIKKVLGLGAALFSGDDNVQIGVLNAMDEQFDATAQMYTQGVETTLSNIPEAKKIAAEQKRKQKERERKAKILAGTYAANYKGVTGVDIEDAAKFFLQTYDPNNTEKLPNLEKEFLTRSIVQQDKINTAVNTRPSFSTERRDAFLKQFTEPTVQDIFEGAAETGRYQEIDPVTGKSRNITAGEIKDYMETATFYDPDAAIELNSNYSYAFPMQRQQQINRNLSEGINRAIGIAEDELDAVFGSTKGQDGQRLFQTEDLEQLFIQVNTGTSNYLRNFAPVVPEERDPSQPVVAGNVTYGTQINLTTELARVVADINESSLRGFSKNGVFDTVSTNLNEKIATAANQQLKMRPIIKGLIDKKDGLNIIARTIYNPITRTNFKDITELAKYDTQTGTDYTTTITNLYNDVQTKLGSGQTEEGDEKETSTPSSKDYTAVSKMVDGRVVKLYRSNENGVLYTDAELTQPFQE